MIYDHDELVAVTRRLVVACIRLSAAYENTDDLVRAAAESNLALAAAAEAIDFDPTSKEREYQDAIMRLISRHSAIQDRNTDQFKKVMSLIAKENPGAAEMLRSRLTEEKK
jgi:hypothetical protein